MKNYYVVLGVGAGTSPEGIRAAYREVVRRLHPGLARDAAQGAFRDVAEAYAVLSDPEQRRMHDRAVAGEAAAMPVTVIRRPAPEPLAPEPIPIFSAPERTHPSFDALADRWQRNFTGRNAPKSEHAESLTLEVVLSPLEAWTGCSVPIGIPVVERCAACGGAGQAWPFRCLDCGGAGYAAADRVIHLVVPPRVRPGAILEVPLDSFGIGNLWLRAQVRISAF